MCAMDDLFIMCINVFYRFVPKMRVDNINKKKYFLRN